MVEWFRRTAQPLVRLTTVQDVEHEAVFEAFAQNLARVAIEERVKGEPRVVSFRARRLAL